MNPIDHEVTQMCMAHESGDVERVRQLLEARPELDRLAPDDTWIHRAADAGHIGLIDFWLDRGWAVDTNLYENSKSDGQATPLHHAKDAATTRHLLKLGASINAWSRFGGTPLHFAVVRALDANQRGRPRATPATQGDQICALLEAGADGAIADFEGRTPLALAVKLKRKLAEQVLRAAGGLEKGHRPARVPTKAPPIDLRVDVKKIATALKKAIQQYSKRPAAEPLTGLHFAVSGVEGFVMIAFDTSDASNPWDASHSDFARVEFPKWRDAYDLGLNGSRIIDVNGVEVARPYGDAEFDRPFFEACVAVLQAPETSRKVKALNRVSTFVFVVEATSGHGESWAES